VAPETGKGDSEIPSPDEAFAILRNEARIDIPETLGEADGPLSVAELRDAVGIR
jgi:hypothetical protein